METIHDRDERFHAIEVETPYGPMKFCALDRICSETHYARGLCHGHWQRLRDGRPLDIIYTHKAYPECRLEGCPRRSQTKRQGLCAVHRRQEYRGIDFREPRPYKEFTAQGRVCRDCVIDKPLSEFYLRNQKKNPTSPNYSRQCKDCFKNDVDYYNGVSSIKSNGEDPLDYEHYPERMIERYQQHLEQNRERMARYHAKKKQNAGL